MKIMEYITLRDRDHAPNPVYWNAVLQTSPLMKSLYGVSLGTEINGFSNGRMSSIMIKKEWDSVGEFISNKIINDNTYFENLTKKTEKAKKEIIFFLNKADKLDYSGFSFDELIKEAQKIMNFFMIYDAASVPAWFMAGDLLKHKIEKILNLSSEEFSIISLPSEKTHTTQMEIDILKSSILENPDIEAEKLAKKYYWVPFNYDGPSIWDKTYFLNKINEYTKEEATKELGKIKENDKTLAKKTEEIIKKIGNPKNSYLIDVIHKITLWTDDRKRLEFQLFYHYDKILRELGKRYKIPLRNLKFIFTEELHELKSSREKLIEESDKRMKNEFFTITNNGIVRIATEKETTEIKAELIDLINLNKISGDIACKGSENTYKARARVILSSKDCSKIREGEFLVATMTSPDFIPAMKKAIGFITDEGGVTCHAAIVSREMNKPCIIGTKIASKVLRDGDLIEVDANKGIVKILKRA